MFQFPIAPKIPVICLALLMAGCSRSAHELKRASVTGTVSFDGQPLQGGTIQFIPQAPTSGPATTAGIVAGKFELPRRDGPIVGTHRVQIVEEREAEPDPDNAEAVKAYLADRKKKKRAPGIPKKYNTESTLTAEIREDGPNQLEFELISKQ